jgi:hypothetical protein
MLSSPAAPTRRTGSPPGQLSQSNGAGRRESRASSSGIAVEVPGGLPFVPSLQPVSASPHASSSSSSSSSLCCCNFRRRILGGRPGIGETGPVSVPNVLRNQGGAAAGSEGAPLPDGAVSASEWIMSRRMRSDASMRPAHDAASARLQQQTLPHAAASNPSSVLSHADRISSTSADSSHGGGAPRSSELVSAASALKKAADDGSGPTFPASQPNVRVGLSASESGGTPIVPPSPRTPGRTVLSPDGRVVRRIGRDAQPRSDGAFVLPAGSPPA